MGHQLKEIDSMLILNKLSDCVNSILEIACKYDNNAFDYSDTSLLSQLFLWYGFFFRKLFLNFFGLIITYSF